MSGIGGIFTDRSRPVREEDLSRIADSIAHRGPDGHNKKLDNSVGLVHCLLQIPSPVSVPQPISNEDRSLTIVCDGRIFNHETLRRQLEDKGHRFSTSSDIEVLLHLYEESGYDFLDRVNGMFALALWDSNKRKLILARDRIGIKPLYYAHAAHGLIFGSEIKAVLTDPAVPRRVNFKAMSDFFALSYIFDGETMFSDVFALPPGCIYVVDDSGTRDLIRYWDMRFAADSDWIEDDLVQTGLEILKEAISLEVKGLSEIGIHLSGGIDSSFITSIAAEDHRDQLVALSAGFREEAYDERTYARQAAEHAGVRFEEIEVFPTADTFMDTMLKVVWLMDEPTVSPGIHSFYMLNEFTGKHVRVVLGGQGSNELLAGYNRYILADISDRLSHSIRHPNPAAAWREIMQTRNFFGSQPLKRMFLEAGQSPEQRALRIVSTFAPSEKQRLFSTGVMEELDGYSTGDHYMEAFNSAPASTTIDRMMYLDMKNMMPNMLRILDRTCAAFHVEARTPYLDHHFVEFAASLSDDAVLRGTESKYILKKMGEGILRHDTIYRDKSGFAAPVTPWLQGHLRREARNVIFSERALSRGYFNESATRSFVERHEKSGKGVWQVWMLLLFELWHRRFIDDDSP